MAYLPHVHIGSEFYQYRGEEKKILYKGEWVPFFIYYGWGVVKIDGQPDMLFNAAIVYEMTP